MNALVATDLDRTMIYSRAAMGDEQFATLETVCVEIYRDAPLSYMTTTAVELMTRLAREVVVVPTTTRTRRSLPGSICPAAHFATPWSATGAESSSTAPTIRNGVRTTTAR